MKVFELVQKGLLTRAIVPVTLITLALAGCGGNEGGDSSQGAEMRPGARPMTAQVQQLVNDGNAAQREGRYEEAMALYREAMAQDEEHPVPQFGALMAAMALGDSVLADSLAVKLETTAPELLGMLNTDGSMGGMPADPHAGGEQGMPTMPPAMGELPAGHPSMEELMGGDTLQPDTSGTR